MTADPAAEPDVSPAKPAGPTGALSAAQFAGTAEIAALDTAARVGTGAYLTLVGGKRGDATKG